MRIRVTSSRGEIFTLNPNERIVHLAFRPSNQNCALAHPGLQGGCPTITLGN